jgi:hypothetical protein
MISLRKPLGSLESPTASDAGLSPLVDMSAMVVWDESTRTVRDSIASYRKRHDLLQC